MGDDSARELRARGDQRVGPPPVDEFSRWRATLDSQPEMICRYRPDATITFVNRAYAEQYDSHPDELVGRSVLDLLPAEAQDWARGHIGELCRNGKPIVHENSVHLPDGSVRYFQWSDHAVSAPDGTVLELQAVGRDITERRLAEDALRASEQRLARMFDLAPIGMAVVDGEGLLVRVNDALGALLGMSEDSLRGCSLDSIVADDADSSEGGGVHGLARAQLCAGQRVVELERRLQAQRQAWGNLSISALDEDPDRASLLVQVVDLSDRKQIEAELAHRAQHDPLTGLPNRSALAEALDSALERAREEGDDVAVLFCDLDGFKLINDTLGHAAGDALLVAVTLRLRECLRAGDVLARFGGDEFVIVHRGRGGAQGAAAHAERVIKTLASPITVSGVDAPVGVTIGVAVAEGGVGDAQALIRDADTAMYAAKADARGTVRVCHDGLRAAVADRFALQQELQAALASDELALHYQPIVRRNGQLVGLEALLRWHHPERGLLVADEFLDVAEDSGFLTPLGAWVVAEACRELAALSENGVVAEHVGMWVNVAPYELSDPALPQRLLETLGDTGLEARRLMLEIPERALAGMTPGTIEELRALRVGVAVDGLGTGRASIIDLLDVTVDAIKIGGTLVRKLDEHGRSRGVITALIDMAKALGAAVVAEGVDTEAQRQALAAMGCDLLQGSEISPPDESSRLRLDEPLLTAEVRGDPAGPG